jgi:ABC-type lipoprotein export system ATPase subunit
MTPASDKDTSDGESVLALEGVSKTYAGAQGMPVTAVTDVTLHVAGSEFVMITGRSGSGKTTLLNLMAGLTAPTNGRVHMDGADVWNLSDQERSRLRNSKIGFVFQFPSLMPTLTVLENVLLPGAFGSRSGPDPESAALEVLDRVGIADKSDAYPRQLSAGQQQRVVLARALVNRPRIILADEPTSNLDECTEQEMMALFRDVHEATGVTIVMVTHSSALVGFGTRTVEMASGRVAHG